MHVETVTSLKILLVVAVTVSALPPKADMCGATRDVRFGPIADIASHERSLKMRLLDYVSNFVLWTYKYDLIFSDEELIRFYFRHFLRYEGWKFVQSDAG
jgi:hypothetical protein